MKKVFILVLLIFILSSCKPQESISIMAPQGSPAMTVLGLDPDDYAIDIVNGPDPLIAAFGSASHDAIIAPTNLGAKLFQSKDDYQLAAILVWGNYHLVSTSYTTLTLEDLHGKDLVVFGRNQTSDIIIKHILESYDIEANITYVDSVQLAAASYLADSTQIVMVAEPSLSKIKTLIPSTASLDLQAIYAELHNGSSYPQAALFVHQSMSNRDVLNLIDSLEQSIHWVNEKSEDVCQKGVEFGIIDDETMFMNAIEGSHLSLKTPDESLDSIHIYLNLILDINPNLIGGQIPIDAFYWSD
ncbi:MAG: hypothetical protein RBQ71_01170 [Acholeplasmataceae bacterium]|jgi:NitT/TauT family transport system substrate-binding protein|nr:hypothetical protein [Acholeplasmataceae bacterium]